MAEPSICVSRDIPASAERIFSVLARPTTHFDVDGTGMLRGVPDDVVISRVGDVFSMKMFNDEIGDYVMDNHVIEFEPERRIAWEPVLGSVSNPQHEPRVGVSVFQVWGWRLEPLDSDHTRVTETYDCSRSPEWLKQAISGGEVWRPGMEASLENLERLATKP